jgi:hypothetical protein
LGLAAIERVVCRYVFLRHTPGRMELREQVNHTIEAVSLRKRYSGRLGLDLHTHKRGHDVL